MLVQVILSRFPSAIYKMKSLNTVTAILIAASLVVGVTGCKKTPKNVTNIPRTNLRPIGEDPSANIRLPSGQQGSGIPKSGQFNPDGTPIGGNLDPNATSRPLTPDELANAQNQTSRPPEGAENRDVLAAETVYFDFDRSTVRGSEVPKVQRVATYLKNQPTAYLRVEGNCDERGTEEYNRSLGERRALAVRELLVASGIAPERVTTVTYGEDKPSDPGHDETAWSKNRRADFVIISPAAGIQTQ